MDRARARAAALSRLWALADDAGSATLCDPEVRDWPTRDPGESMVDASTRLPLHGPPGLADRPGRSWVRASVLSRLCEAAAGLPAPLGLALVEGWRSAQDQEREFAQERTLVQRAHPALPRREVDRRTARYVAPPGPAAPHASGGAVDVVVVRCGGQLVDMGCGVNETGGVSTLCYTGSPAVHGQAREHRAQLVRAMESAGFVNYPYEWWHWSFGDRYWGYVTGRPARYDGLSNGSGSTAPPQPPATTEP